MRAHGVLACLALLAVGSSACGGSNEDRPPARIVSTVPADGAEGVRPSSTIVVTWSEPLDVSTVNRKNVRLAGIGTDCYWNRPTELLLSDDHHQLVIRHAPVPARHYRLSLQGLRDANGNELPKREIRWDYTSHLESTHEYDGATSPAGTSYERIDLIYDPKGRHIETQMRNPGPDSEWNTPDDAIRTREILELDGSGFIVAMAAQASDFEVRKSFDRDERGVVLRTTLRERSGADGEWNTDDDVITYSDFYSHDDEGLCTFRRRHLSRGSDGIWGTTDDFYEYGRRFFYDENGQLIRTEKYQYDGYREGERMELDSLGNTVARWGQEAGSDRLWDTEDDTLRVSRTSFDGVFPTVTEVHYPGPDGVLGTGDDNRLGKSTSEFDRELGVLIGENRYAAASGADAFERISSRSSTERIEGRRVMLTRSSGANGEWGDADDRLTRTVTWRDGY